VATAERCCHREVDGQPNLASSNVLRHAAVECGIAGERQRKLAGLFAQRRSRGGLQTARNLPEEELAVARFRLLAEGLQMSPPQLGDGHLSELINLCT